MKLLSSVFPSPGYQAWLCKVLGCSVILSDTTVRDSFLRCCKILGVVLKTTKKKKKVLLLTRIYTIAYLLNCMAFLQDSGSLSVLVFFSRLLLLKISLIVFSMLYFQCFCSNFCYRASKYFEAQISKSPVWMREEEM